MIRSTIAVSVISFLLTTAAQAQIIDPEAFSQKSPRKLYEESLRRLAGLSSSAGVAVGPGLLRIAIIDGRDPTKIYDSRPNLPWLDSATAKQCNIDLTRSAKSVKGVIEAIRALVPKSYAGAKPNPSTDDDATQAFHETVKSCGIEWQEVKDTFGGANARPIGSPIVQ